MKLKGPQNTAIQLLVEGRGYGATAKALGISEVTLWRWRQDPDFRAELDRERGIKIEEYRAACDASGYEAVETLRELLRSGSDMVRCKAATAILDRCGVTPVTQKERRLAEETVVPASGEDELYMEWLTEKARREREERSN